MFCGPSIKDVKGFFSGYQNHEEKWEEKTMANKKRDGSDGCC